MEEKVAESREVAVPASFWPQSSCVTLGRPLLAGQVGLWSLRLNKDTSLQ